MNVGVHVGIGTTKVDGTVDGTWNEAIITVVECPGIGTNGTDDGTNVIGTTTGDGGKTDVGGNGKFKTYLVVIGVGTGTTNVDGTLGGTYHVGTITKVVPGIVTYSTVDGSNAGEMITGDHGNSVVGGIERT
jgi:hypothetical protein